MPFGSGSGGAWNLTTSFPGYPFQNDKLYLIGLYTPSNPDCCFDEGWTYQLTFNHRSSDNRIILSDKQKNELKSLFGVVSNHSDNDSSHSDIFPNPTKNIIYLQTKERSITKYEVFSISGTREVSYTNRKKEKINSIDLSQLKTGIYNIQISFDDGTILSKKLIKK